MRTYEIVESIETVLHCDTPAKVIAGEYGMATAIAEYTSTGQGDIDESGSAKAHRNKILTGLAEYITYNKVSVKSSVDVMVALFNKKYEVGYTSFLRNIGVGSVISTDTFNCIEDNYASYSRVYRRTTDLLKSLTL